MLPLYDRNMHSIKELISGERLNITLTDSWTDYL